MGQRNEKSLKKKMEEAREAVDNYEHAAQQVDSAEEANDLIEKQQRAKHFIEFSRWMLGHKSKLEF